MKKYFVARVYKTECIMPYLVFNTDNVDDAYLYAELQARNDDDDHKYVVLEVTNGTIQS